MSAITVNGSPWDAPAGTTVTDLVDTWCPSRRGVAVARNGDVVPRSAWDAVLVATGDAVEIVTAAAGG